MNKLTFQMITFLLKIMLSHSFSCGFCGTNQFVSIFILSLMVNENVTCSLSWGYGGVTTVVCSIDYLIIFPSYDIHHVHESQSDGMDHQWFQNTILIDIIKVTFLYIISLLYIYSLVREHDHFNHTKRNLIVNDNVTCSFSRAYVAVICNMQYWLSSTRMLIINPCYEVHHVHGSRSDGMDHQWF